MWMSRVVDKGACWTFLDMVRKTVREQSFSWFRSPKIYTPPGTDSEGLFARMLART